MEPALTNIGIVLPQEGYLQGVRELTRRRHAADQRRDPHVLRRSRRGHRGVGPRPRPAGHRQGDRRRHPCRRLRDSRRSSPSGCVGRTDRDLVDMGGVGGTLAGNALSLAATRATLERGAHRRGVRARWSRWPTRSPTGVRAVIAAHDVPWSVTQLGARAEYRFMAEPPRNGTRVQRRPRRRARRLPPPRAALNRGVLMTPFHNMALMSPATSAADVDRPHRGCSSRRSRRSSADEPPPAPAVRGGRWDRARRLVVPGSRGHRA